MHADAAADEIDVLFRSVHTIKGMSAAMGFSAVESIAHALEDALGRLRDAPRAGRIAAFPHLPAAIDALDDAVEASLAPGASTESPEVAPHVRACLDRVSAAAAARSAGTGSSPTNRVESAADPSDPAGAAAPAVTRTVRVDAETLDRLLELAGELTNVRDRLARAAAHTGDAPLARAVADLGRVSGALVEEVRTSRLVALAELLAELPRIVRQAARATGKRVTLETSGGDVVADRAVIDALAEPLTHLLRNAVDHGIEPPDERARRGKLADGRVAVRVTRDGNSLVVRVEDDGRGVDRAAVLARARARGLPPSLDVGGDAGTVDDATLLACLAMPGLSTAREVGRVSGRGVGVDAALARVRALGGALTLHTTAGVGTSFTLHMPLSWAVVPALVVRAGAAAYAIPLAHVRGTRDGGAGDEGSPSLGAVLGCSARGHVAEHGAEVVLLSPGPDAPPFAVRVDELIGARDCVLKPVVTPRGAPRIAAGATILEGGEVVLVLDVPAVAARAAIPAFDDTPPRSCPSHPPLRPAAASAPTTRAR